MQKQIGLFLAKCLTFSLVFFVSWVLFFRPVNSYLNERSEGQKTSQSQEGDSTALMKAYWEQIESAKKLQQAYVEQQAQSARALQKQDELLARWEKVIEKWEKR